MDSNTLKNHRNDFEQLYKSLPHSLKGIQFPLADIDSYEWKRGDHANDYFSYMYRRFSCHILSHLDLHRGQRLLIVGCGRGFDEKNIKYLFPNIRLVSIDISLEMVRRAVECQSPSKFIVSGAEFLPFPDCSFDRILCREVIEHAMDPDRMMREIYRVLRPGGKTVITTENSESLALGNIPFNRIEKVLNWLIGSNSKPEIIQYKDKAPTLKEFFSLANNIGFDIIEFFWDGALYKTLPRFQYLFKGKRLTSLAHRLSALENNQKLAYLMCDQVKYIVQKPRNGHIDNIQPPQPTDRKIGNTDFTLAGPNMKSGSSAGPKIPIGFKSQIRTKFENFMYRFTNLAHSTSVLLLGVTLTLFLPSNKRQRSRLLGKRDQYLKYLY